MAPCCISGTALGDPIELGAALSVLRPSGALLHLTAAKSRLGHSEPAAGAVGIGQASVMSAYNVSRAVSHLRSLNPMLAGLLHSHPVPKRTQLCVPRQGCAGLLPGTASRAARGVSAFAFQGTNAHVVLVRGASLPAAQLSNLWQWQRRRFWFLDASHAFASRVSVTQHSVQLQTTLHHDSLAYLWDHQVQHRTLLPGTAMLETACAAGVLLASRSSNGGIHQVEELPAPALQGTIIPVPVVLPQPGPSCPTCGVLLTTTAEQITGRFAIHGSHNGRSVHLDGRLCSSGTHVHSPFPTPTHERLQSGYVQSNALPWLAGLIPVPAVGRQQPTSTTTVQQNLCGQPDQYFMHPAVTDSALQARGHCWQAFLLHFL